MKGEEGKPMCLINPLLRYRTTKMLANIVKHTAFPYDKWRVADTIPITKLLLIHEYDDGMLGVDKSDQLIASNNVLMKCARWWKNLPQYWHCYC